MTKEILDKDIMIKALKNACENGRLKIVNSLGIRVKEILGKDIMIELFKTTIKNNYLDIVRSLFNHFNVNYIIKSEVREWAEIEKLENLEMVKLIRDMTQYIHILQCNRLERVSYLTFLMACKEGRMSFLEYTKESVLMNIYLTKKVCQEAVVVAAKNGQIEVLKFLHSAFCFDKSDLMIDITFIKACQEGHLEIVKYLHINYDLKREILDKDMIYAFKRACWGGHLEIVKYLINYDLKREILDKDMIYAFKRACCDGHLEIVKYLHVNFGMTKEILGKDMIEACENACKNGHLEIVEYLYTDVGATECEMSEKSGDPAQLIDKFYSMINDINS
jgi:hypothetical protein